MLNKGELKQFLWPDALPVTNQQESFAGPHLFLTTKTPKERTPKKDLVALC